MKHPEDFIEEITLGNASQQDIKGYIRLQARRIAEIETQLNLIRLKEQEKALARKRQSLARFIERNNFY